MLKSIYKRHSLCKEMLILFSVFFLPGIIAQSGAMAGASFDNMMYLIQIVLVAVPQVLLILYVLELRGDTDRERFGLHQIRARDLLSGLLYYLALLGVFIPVGLLVSLLPNENMREAIPNVSWSFSRLELLPAIALAMLAVGYREELFFRSYMVTRLEQLGLGGLGAIIVSTILFSIGHLYQGVAGLAVSLVIGMLFGVIYVRRRNLHGLAIAHALYNVTVLLGRYALTRTS